MACTQVFTKLRKKKNKKKWAKEDAKPKKKVSYTRIKSRKSSKETESLNKGSKLLKLDNRRMKLKINSNLRKQFGEDPSCFFMLVRFGSCL